MAQFVSSMQRSCPAIAIWSPGCRHDDGGNVGLPHLVALASYVAAQHNVRVAIFDHDYECRLGHEDDNVLFSGNWDIIGLSCYSSFDYQIVMAMAKRIRALFPRVCLVVGGYHPSACPEDFTGPDSSFNYVIVGEGEIPLSQIVQVVQNGGTLDAQVVGPILLPMLDELPPLRWDLLDRYRDLLMDQDRQLNINLSRGCPFSCEFCMERSKRSSHWRAYSPGRAVDELHRLLAAFPRTGGVLRITDALFAFDPAWRCEFLDRLNCRSLPVGKIWVVTRSDLIKEGDLKLLHAAGFAVGFGIESGDPGMLQIMRKTPDPDRFLQHFAAQAQEAEAIGMPWGANLIAGHPGETPESLSRSAAWCANLVRELRRPTGFICVDPYRYYPGSAVHQRLADYEVRYGTHVRTPDWWRSEDPTTNSSVVDASRELSFERREELRRELFLPVLADLLSRFAYRGPESRYFTETLNAELESVARPLIIQNKRYRNHPPDLEKMQNSINCE
jgi:radical SAM superfamily enzyme YgiQ (UPF0313 family)